MCLSLVLGSPVCGACSVVRLKYCSLLAFLELAFIMDGTECDKCDGPSIAVKRRRIGWPAKLLKSATCVGSCLSMIACFRQDCAFGRVDEC